MTSVDSRHEDQLHRHELAVKRRACLALGVLCLLLMGLVYGFSMFTRPMIADFGLHDVGFAFYVMMICFCVGNLISSVSLGKFGTKTTLLFVAILFAAGFGLTGLFCAQGGTVVLYLCYSVLGGLGAGMGYNVTIAVVNLWFPDKVGVASGLLLLGFGFASLVFGNAALVLRGIIGSIGPVFVCIGLAGAAVALAFSRVLTFPPADIATVFPPQGAAAAQGDAADPSAKFEDDEILKSPTFYAYFVPALLLGAMGLGVIGSIAADGMALGIPEAPATMLVALITTCNGFARIAFGAVLDRIGMPKTFIISMILAVMAMALIVVAFATGNAALYVVGAFCGGFSYGGGPVLGSTFARQRYGAKNYPSNLAISTFNIVFSALANIVISLAVGPDRQLFFVVILVCTCIALAGAVLLKRMWDCDMARPA